MIDKSRIQELRDDIGEDDLAEVIALFCGEIDDLLANLETVDRAGYPDRIHFLKGSALNIGLNALGELCRAEETRLAADPSARPDIPSIRAAFARARRALMAGL